MREARALADRLETPLLTCRLACLCEMVGNPELGIVYLRKCLAVFPRDLGGLFTLARLLISTGQRDAARVAVEGFRKACETSDEELRDGYAELVPSFDIELAQLGP